LKAAQKGFQSMLALNDPDWILARQLLWRHIETGDGAPLADALRGVWSGIEL
jgi:hypothetical protein